MSSSLYRQSSFSDRSSYRRRAESLSRQTSSLARYSTAASSAYTSVNTDYVSASRRTSLFNGYSGFAIYSSISQGLDEITYGGRLSRRNSITEKTHRRGSITNLSANDYSLPTLLATYEATRAATASTKTPDREDRSNSRQMSRQESFRTDEVQTPELKPKQRPQMKKQQQQMVAQPPPPQQKVQPQQQVVAQPPPPPPPQQVQQSLKPKLRRRVSFTDRDPVIIARRVEDEEEEEEEEEEEPRKPRRKKEKEGKSRHKKKNRDKSADPSEVETARERRKSQPVGDDLFVQVSSKLKELEMQHQPLALSLEESAKQDEAAIVDRRAEAKQPVAVYSVKYPDPAFEDLSSTASSKGMTSSEASPPQKKKENRNSGLFSSSSSLAAVASSASADQFSIRGSSSAIDAESFSSSSSSSVQYREKSGATASSRSGSKRNSLDGKTVQGLAQDLAAECAKAYALMESSLSKLSNEFGGGPFGMAPKNKVRLD
jgi:hypothetical protein